MSLGLAEEGRLPSQLKPPEGKKKVSPGEGERVGKANPKHQTSLRFGREGGGER